MKVQQLIEKYKKLEGVWDAEGAELARQIFLQDLEQLDETKPVKVPQFVAGWIKYCKLTSVNLYHAFEMGDLYFCNYANQKDYLKLKEFFEVKGNQELFARAWLDGYEVEKEPKYIVKMKGLSEHYSYLNYDSIDNEWYFSDSENGPAVGTNRTRKELEEAGFGEVFNSPLFEVEEVE